MTTLHGIPAHRLLSGSMQRALLAYARDHRVTIALVTLRDLQAAGLVWVDPAGERHLTRAGQAIAEDLEATG